MVGVQVRERAHRAFATCRRLGKLDVRMYGLLMHTCGVLDGDLHRAFALLEVPDACLGDA